MAQQNEFLNRSVRGSKKLRELEHEPPESGIVNDGFSSEHEEDKTVTLDEPHDPYEPIYRVVGKCHKLYRINTAVLNLLRHPVKIIFGAAGPAGFTSKKNIIILI